LLLETSGDEILSKEKEEAGISSPSVTATSDLHPSNKRSTIKPKNIMMKSLL